MKVLAIDTEYAKGNTVWTTLRSYSYSWDHGVAHFVEWGDKAAIFLQGMLDSLEPGDKLVMHNQIADSVILTVHGIRVPFELLEDTMVMAAVLCEPSIGLKDLAYRHQNMHMTVLEELTGSGKKERSVLDIPADELAPYACADADATRRLYLTLAAKLALEPSLQFVYESIERPLFEPLVDMQITGLCLDLDVLAALGRDVDEVIKTEQEALWSIAGRQLNLSSNTQLQAYVYGDLAYEPISNSKTGRNTLDSKAVTRLRFKKDHPFLARLPFFKQAVKLKSTYINGLPKLVGPSGRLHPTPKQVGTGTGRMSSEDPNSQNLPIRTKLGARIREAFVAPKGYRFVGADCAALEVRTLALVSREPKLVNAFQEAGRTGVKFDVHRWVEDNAHIPRRGAKILTFGRTFGQGKDAAYTEVVFAFQEANETPPTLAEFEDMYSKHAQILSALPIHERNTRNAILNQGYVETYYGRRMYCTDLRGPAFRSALSMGPQGTGGDTIKLMIPPVWKLCKATGSSLVNAVHDELSCYVPDEAGESFEPAIKTAMESAVSWPIPMLVEVLHGNSWASAH